MTEQQFEALLHQALRPEIDPKDTAFSRSPHGKGQIMNFRKAMKQAAAVLAAVLILTTTAYAADFMNIKSLVTTGGKEYHSESYKDMGKAMKQAGFEITAPESFENGYAFRNVRVGETGAYDEHDKELFTYKDLVVYYKNPAGTTLSLFTHIDREELSQNSRDRCRRSGWRYRQTRHGPFRSDPRWPRIRRPRTRSSPRNRIRRATP